MSAFTPLCAKKIAVYGKGGIGKSTTVSNVSAAFSLLGLTVMHIGCDPKADSTSMLTGGRRIKPVLDVLREKPAESVTLEDVVHRGFNGVLCVESGGPTPGIGCAGRGIITAFEKLESLHAFETYRPDIVLYDVLGDVVCGGFALPMRGGYADTVVIVTSGELMARYAAQNIASAVKNFEGRGYAKVGGIILNRRNVENEESLVEQTAAEIGCPIIAEVPRSSLVQQAEAQGKTVVECFPESDMAAMYRKLAKSLLGEAAS